MVRGIAGNQTLVILVIRTAGNPLKSRPSKPLLISVLAVVAIATVLPYTAVGTLLRFTPLPLSLLGAIAFLAVTYPVASPSRQVLVPSAACATLIGVRESRCSPGTQLPKESLLV
jgi:hypothetical protein